MNEILKIIDLKRNYKIGNQTIEVLKGVNLTVRESERVAITGTSGSGKTTLLTLTGSLDKPTSGEIYIDNYPIHNLNETQTNKIRNDSIGFVYQFHHLLGEFTALENVAIPMMIKKTNKTKIKQRAAELLAMVGLENRVNHKPPQLSGGERQRVAIARALANNPKLILLDEPTGNLDNETAYKINQLLLEISQKSKTAFVLVTHNEKLAAEMETRYVLENGILC